MVRPPTLLIVLTACALGALSAAPRAQAPGPTPISVTSISGRVIDGATGAPIGDAVVRIGGVSVYDAPDQILVIDTLDQQLRERKRRTKVRTDPLGRFAFNDLPSGSYGISVEMEGWTTGTYGATRPGEPSQWLDLVEGQRATATVVLWRHPWIGGTVVDERGEPVEYATVGVMRRSSRAGQPSLITAGYMTTDDQGRYGGLVPPGEYVVRVQADRIRVREWTGADAPMFAFPPVFYPASLSPEGAEPITVAAADRFTNADVRLPLRQLHRLAGQLTNPAGVGQVPKSVTLVSRDGLETRRGAAVDAQGRFLFDRLLPGQYLLEATTYGNLVPGPVPTLWARTIVDVQDADAVVTLQLRRGLIVRGRLAFDGADPPAAELLREFSLFMLRPPAQIGDVIPPHVQVQTDGTFMLELPGGPYLAKMEVGFNMAPYLPGGPPRPSQSEIEGLRRWRVRAADVNGRDIMDTPLDLIGDVTGLVITLTQDRAEAVGRVRVRSGRPQDYRVVLIPADPSIWAHPEDGRRFMAVPVWSDGRFKVTAPAGDYLAGAVRGMPREWRVSHLIGQLAAGMTGIHLVEGASLQIAPPVFAMPPPSGGSPPPLEATDSGLEIVRPAIVSPLPLPALPGATVTGRVVSAEDGQPLGDVRVSAYPSVGADVFTDAAGTFILQRVQPGSRPFRASKRGWVEASGGQSGMVLMVNGDRVDDVVIRMTRTSEISGTVHDQNGDPVSGLGVRAWKYQPGRDLAERTHRSPDGSAVTGEQGQYRLTGLLPGRYLVSTVPYIARDQTEIPVTTDYDLDRAAGRASPRGERRPPPPRGLPAVFNDGATDSTSAVPIELSAGVTRSVDLNVRSVPLATVNITLHSPDGGGLSNVSARLEVADRIIRSLSQLWEYPERQEAGTLVFQNMLPGRYAFGARTPARGGVYFSAFADVVVTDAEQQNLTLDLMPGATVSGRLTVDGAAPAPGAGLSIRAFDVTNRMDFAIAEAGAPIADDGTFTVSNLMPGRYRFSVSRQGRTFENVPVSQSAYGRETLHHGLEVSASQQITNVHLAVASTGADVAGVVRDPSGGSSPATTVVIFPAAREAWHPRSPHILSVRTDRQGAYLLKNVPPGRYRIAAAALPPDVWLDAEVLSTLVERSEPALVESSRPLVIDLATP